MTHISAHQYVVTRQRSTNIYICIDIYIYQNGSYIELQYIYQNDSYTKLHTYTY